jgi:hypothetical protein
MPIDPTQRQVIGNAYFCDTIYKIVALLNHYFTLSNASSKTSSETLSTFFGQKIVTRVAQEHPAAVYSDRMKSAVAPISRWRHMVS